MQEQKQTNWGLIALLVVVVVILVGLIGFLLFSAGNNGDNGSGGQEIPPESGQPPVSIPEPGAGKPQLVANSDVNVRNGPGTNYQIYGVLPGGSRAPIQGVSADGSWWAITILGLPTDRGWVSADFVSAENADGVPVIEGDDPNLGMIELPPPGEGAAALTATANVNVRRGPGTDYGSYGLLANGARAEIVGKNSEATWWAVNYPDGENGQGWISADFSTAENADGVPVLPAP